MSWVAVNFLSEIDFHELSGSCDIEARWGVDMSTLRSMHVVVVG